MNTQIVANLQWIYGITKNGKYVAVCEPIRQTIQADTFTEMMASMDEALKSTFDELLSTGDLESFLKEHGWRTEGPKLEKNGPKCFDVPFDLKQVPERDLEAVLC